MTNKARIRLVVAYNHSNNETRGETAVTGYFALFIGKICDPSATFLVHAEACASGLSNARQQPTLVSTYVRRIWSGVTYA